ncbi:MAG TPA: Na+/H+ antiporter NhaA [Steroidobacteraceae bacterium]|nr:Na+/H+ antiporter NhaA [Steroidobacteraceae bacterium]
MTDDPQKNRLDRPVDDARDHVLGPAHAGITLVEYGSYACPHCRAANERISQVRDQFGERLRYVFRHRPLTGSDLARRAAELVERTRDPDSFWDAHIKLMTRSETLTEDDLRAVADDLGLEHDDERASLAARQRVEADERSARASGVLFTPTFFINGRRYDGPWDETSFADAMLGSLGHRVRAAALDFAAWAPSAGVLLLIATILAVTLTNSPLGPGIEAFWSQSWGLVAGEGAFLMPLHLWINDGLLTVFFLVVGLEIKREFTVGHLASRRSAALPIAAAIGGMVVPALLYVLLIPAGPWDHGWGVPMATDTAFAVALIVMLGRRVPVELRIFLTAAAIVDDIGAITVVALFYSGALDLGYLAAGCALVAALALLNRWRVYRATPYVLVGVLLWCAIHAGGLHATLTGVVLAMFIPTRPPPNLHALMTQANNIVQSEAERGEEVLRHGPSLPALRALDDIHDRLESPADRMLRHLGPRSSYLVLPLFALANAGVALDAGVMQGHEPLMLAILAALFVGKPLGLVLACVLAVRLGLAVKPAEYSWLQLGGAGALAGIGFTMSLFIAAVAFPSAGDFAAAKIAVFGASALSAILGVAILWRAGRNAEDVAEQRAPGGALSASP